jgi:hypothetical protein
LLTHDTNEFKIQSQGKEKLANMDQCKPHNACLLIVTLNDLYWKLRHLALEYRCVLLLAVPEPLTQNIQATQLHPVKAKVYRSKEQKSLEYMRFHC